MHTPVGANSSWQQRSLRSVWHPCTQMQRAAAVPPLPIARGEGPWLIDHEGQRYFDATSSWWVNLFGHADARINAALKDQLDRLPHVMLAGCTHAPAVELAERLSALTDGVLGHCFYAANSALFFQGYRHCTFAMRKGPTIGPIELPRAAELARSYLGPAAP